MIEKILRHCGLWCPSSPRAPPGDGWVHDPATAITATGVNKVYDGSTTATVTLSDDRVSGDVFTDSYTTTSFGDENVGSGKAGSVSGISIGGTDAGNYTFNTEADPTAAITALHITGAFTAADKVYDGTADATVLTRSTVGDVGGVNLTGGTASFDSKNVGSGKTVTLSGVVLSGVNAGNYVVDSVAPTTADITPAPTTTVVDSSANPSAYGQPAWPGGTACWR